ncbi:MAG: cupredoxin domain-containing protein [Candidatus Anstonellales archaeon]
MEKIRIQKTTWVLFWALLLAGAVTGGVILGLPGALKKSTDSAQANGNVVENRVLYPSKASISSWSLGGCGCNENSWSKLEQNETNLSAAKGEMQEIYIKALGTGRYEPEEVRVKKGVPVRLYFSAEPSSGCGRYMILDEFGVRLYSKNGETQVVEFTPNKVGSYRYHCSMNMFVGKMVVE